MHHSFTVSLKDQLWPFKNHSPCCCVQLITARVAKCIVSLLKLACFLSYEFMPLTFLIPPSFLQIHGFFFNEPIVCICTYVLSLYNVTCVYVFGADCLTLVDQLVRSSRLPLLSFLSCLQFCVRLRPPWLVHWCHPCSAHVWTVMWVRLSARPLVCFNHVAN